MKNSKKMIGIVAAFALCAALLAGCGNTSSSTASSEASSAASTVESTDTSASEAADSKDLDAIVAAIEAVNPVPNPRVIDEFSMENEMGLTADNILSFKGDVTNDQADCALVFVAQVKDGTAATVEEELKAYQGTMTSSLYLEFADKVAKAQDARIVVDGNYVVMVIAGVSGPDYSEIDTAIAGALA